MSYRKTVACKKCQTPNLFWIQSNITGKWTLQDAVGGRHSCGDSIRLVKCKYCNSEDLHWAEELQPDGGKKMILTESYGLPHACDEKLAALAKQRQEKKDAYQAIKTKINNIPDGPCPSCSGTGRGKPPSTSWHCEDCCGHGTFSMSSRKSILYQARQKIWPGINSRFIRDDVPF